MKYKDQTMDKIYSFLLGKTPDDLKDAGIFGALLHAFQAGYEGRPRPLYIPRGTPAYAAYMAGRDSGNKEIKEK